MRLPLTTLFIVLFCTSSLASARGHMGGGEHHSPGPALEELAVELGLDEATVESLKAIRKDARDATMEIRFEIKKLKVAMHDALDQDSPNETEIMGMVEAIGKLKIEVKKTHMRALLKARTYLNPDQLKVFRKLKKNHHRKRKNRH